MRQLACILIALAVVGVYGDEPEKLVNGIATSVEQYPHAVSIRVNNNHFCGGSIISPTRILTAAHCVVPLLQSSLSRSLYVVTGTTYLNSGGQVHRVSNMWYHESYNPNDPSGRGPFDIGLLQLSAPITFGPKQQPIKLPTQNVIKGEPVTIVAWGGTGFRQPVHNNLQKLDANLMFASDCQRYHQNLMRIHPNEFCTLIATGTGACNGDSGSGVVRRSDKTIIGLVSGGIPCAKGYPDVFTTVAPYLSWIEQRM